MYMCTNNSNAWRGSGVEKVSEPGNLVPRKFFELRVSQKKILENISRFCMR
jgi:hypothetical protein